MNRSQALDRLSEEVRQAAAGSPEQAAAAIESLLENRWSLVPASERLVLLEELSARFGARPAAEPDTDNEVLAEVVSLLLGRRVINSSLSPAELLQRLADSLNTLFDSLNRLVRVIQSTLMGAGNPDETIHTVIGEHLQGEDRLKSLENYIGQINKAFLLTHQSFKAAAERTIQKLLRELSPKALDPENAKGLRFGPLRKADLYEAYEQKFQQCQRWFESGKFADHLLREVERYCQQKISGRQRPAKGGSR
jgi:hypothetical protein